MKRALYRLGLLYMRVTGELFWILNHKIIIVVLPKSFIQAF